MTEFTVTMKNKKLLFVANTAWSMYKFRLPLLRALRERGYEPVIVAPRDEHSGKLRELGFRVIDIQLSQKGINPLDDLRTYFQLKKIYRKESPFHIFHYTIKPNIYGSIAANALKLPATSIVTGLGYTFINKTVVSRIAVRLYRFAFRRAKEVWFLNEEDINTFVQGNIVDPKKTFLLNGEGVDTQSFSPPPGLPVSSNKDTTFCFIGRLLYDKGIREYVHAARVLKRKHANLQFQIVGFLNVANPSAVTRQEMSDWVGEGIVQYLGAVDDVKPIIAAADCIVLPSYREGMSMILMESASMAKPIITTDIPGCQQLVDDGVTGFLCKTRDAADLILQLEKFIGLRSEQRIEMGNKARKKMLDCFDVERVIEVYLHKLAS